MPTNEKTSDFMDWVLEICDPDSSFNEYCPEYLRAVIIKQIDDAASVLAMCFPARIP